MQKTYLCRMFFRKYSILIIFIWLISISCSKYTQLLKSTDLKLKYEMAVKYFEEEEYYKAYPLFEELIVVYKGTVKAEKLYHYGAYCDYYLKDYVLASHRFKQFSDRFPNSEYAEECLFMSAYCYYLNSPKYSLDQTNTYKAIKELQLFVNQYSGSSRLDSCNVLMDKLRSKLEIKSFKNAWQYYHTRNYKSAIIAFNHTMQDYPDTKYREECMFLIIKSNYLLAMNSVESKKAARLKDTTEAYIKFVDAFPVSDKIKEAETLYKNVIKEKEKFTNQNS